MDAKTNMRIYDLLAEVPEQAKKEIKGGRLKGFTDINPMWRIEKLTETFGPCGIGWYTEVIKQWSEAGSNGEIMSFCNINLYVRETVVDKSTMLSPDSYDGWSKPIFGTGGSSFVEKESGGLYTSDEGYKMAYTDAISVACKALGMGANVYWMKGDRTKYTRYDNPEAGNNHPDGKAANHPGAKPTNSKPTATPKPASNINHPLLMVEPRKDGKVRWMTDEEFSMAMAIDSSIVLSAILDKWYEKDAGFGIKKDFGIPLKQKKADLLEYEKEDNIEQPPEDYSGGEGSGPEDDLPF